jgi:hypothetical protein
MVLGRHSVDPNGSVCSTTIRNVCFYTYESGGCRIARLFLVKYTKSRKKYTKIHQMTIKYTYLRNGNKIDQMSIQYNEIFHCKTIHNLPKLGFLVRKYTICQPCWFTTFRNVCFYTYELGGCLFSTLMIGLVFFNGRLFRPTRANLGPQFRIIKS